MPIEPVHSRVNAAQQARQRNPYEGRWNWWYSSIADIMIRDPSITKAAIALELDKSATTISFIVNTNLFQDYLAQRKEEWRKQHDHAILSKLTRVAELSLDSVAEHLEKKKDQVPLPVAVEAMTSALDRLGYGIKQQPAVSVQVNQDNSRTQTVVIEGVSATALEEARTALRVAEGKRALEYDAKEPPPLGGRDGRLIEHDQAPLGAEPAPLGASDNDSSEAQADLFSGSQGSPRDPQP
jgi:hypothetical protein